MYYTRLLTAIIVTATLCVTCLSARAGEAFAEYQVKAAFILKFTQFTTWPKLPAGQEFKLCLYGADVFKENLSVFEGKGSGGRKVTVKRVATLDEIKECQAIFINPARQNELSYLVAQLRTLPILTISDHATAWDEGVMIVMNTEPNRVVFSINHTAARAAGLELNANMINLAQEVK